MACSYLRWTTKSGITVRVTKRYRTETAHRLLNHKGLCRFIHGHSYLWEITVEGRPNDDGMVTDFKDLKLAIEQVLKPFDHALVLSEDDAAMLNLLAGSNVACINDLWSRVIWLNGNPTAENFAQYAAERLIEDHGLNVVRVRCWETVNSYADWEG